MKKLSLTLFFIVFLLGFAYNQTDTLVFAQKMPEYRGGFDSLKLFIYNNLDYSELHVEQSIQGTVYVRFIVNEIGEVSNIEVVRGIDPFVDKLALDVIKKLPNFKPGMQNGVPVCVWIVVPVAFKL